MTKKRIMKFLRRTTTRRYTAVTRFLTDQAGPTSVEYAVVLAMITTVVFGSVVLVGGATGENVDLALEAIRKAFAP